MKFNQDFLAQMREATHLLRTSGPADATAVIRRALQGAPQPSQPNMFAALSAAEIESSSFAQTLTPRASMDTNSVIDAEFVEERALGQGQFLRSSLTNHAGTRAYQLYLPSGYQKGSSTLRPLLVMLHGCKQNPEDFAAGTQMNEIAERHDCIVLYPGQAQAKNVSNCWNWFSAGDQIRDHGEPSIIADITRRVVYDCGVDPNRVYIAGLSAGGAMAAIMGQQYPDIFAAVGVHSGLPVGAAADVVSAFAAMKNGAVNQANSRIKPNANATPIIVFHGDSDPIVHLQNATDVIAQFTSNRSQDAMEILVENVAAASGKTKFDSKTRGYTRKIYRDRQGENIAEHWVIQGGGHAWSGGDAAGSYTDPIGPNASKEMLRFFLAHTLSN